MTGNQLPAMTVQSASQAKLTGWSVPALPSHF